MAGTVRKGKREWARAVCVERTCGTVELSVEYKVAVMTACVVLYKAKVVREKGRWVERRLDGISAGGQGGVWGKEGNARCREDVDGAYVSIVGLTLEVCGPCVCEKLGIAIILD